MSQEHYKKRRTQYYVGRGVDLRGVDIRGVDLRGDRPYI